MPENASAFPADEIGRHLTTSQLGRELHWFAEVDSTNTVARELARRGAVHGAAVIADAQTAGRGRLGRGWVSPPGRNLYLSVVLRPSLDPEKLSLLTLAAGVAACEAVREWCPSARLKWPNDVLVEGRKVVGILCEIESDGDAPTVIAGIGVNLNSAPEDFPPELREKAGSLAMASGRAVDRSRFTARLLGCVETWLDRLDREGFAAVGAAWERLSAMTGQTIRVREPGGVVNGRVLGLAADGALRIATPSGAERRVVAGDVTVIGGYEKEGTR